ncbi:glycine--tRNA ligase [Erysipelotrichaceae bacterium]|nr:glycine--tRNA ligase [Erysipelotrichaceae bacterium]
MTVKMEDIVNFAKSRGFVYQGSEIYGGLANTWDYGPLGSELKSNLKRIWWQKFIQQHDKNVGIDTALLMNPKVWEASGHIGGFSDPLTDCKACNTRHRADKLIEDFDANITADGWSNERLEQFITDNNIACPDCGAHAFTAIRQFNLMFKTQQGVIEDATSDIYLRPETAQGIFVNFKNVQRTTRKKVPFGIGQIGKSFRNEITPGNFIFRTREFEQMELEFFCKPGEDLKWHAYWQDFCFQFLLNLGINERNLKLHIHDAEELSHYSNATTDIQYRFPFGFGELWGIADRTDYDLTQHQNHAKTSMEYFEEQTGERYIPYCIEPSVGVDRLLLALLVDAYKVEILEDGQEREVLSLHPALAPFKATILPLSKKLSDTAVKIYEDLAKKFTVDYDESGSIGKRYRRQDAIGTKYCITIDFDTLEDNSVTVRDRDTMAQIRVPITDLEAYIAKSIEVA